MAGRVLLFEEPWDPFLNLAFEEVLVVGAGCGLYDVVVRFWRNANAVVVGYFQGVWEEADPAGVRSVGAVVARRISGGGTVYHDLGNLNYSVVVRRELVGDDPLGFAYGRVLGVVVGALERLGFRDVGVVNETDVVVGGYKVSGNAAGVKWGALLVHGTLLVSTPPEVVYRVIPPPPREVVEKRGVDPVKYRVSSLERLRGGPVGFSEVVSALWEGFRGLFGDLVLDMPLGAELEAARVLRELYSDPGWVLERKPSVDARGLREEARRLLCRG